MTLPNILTVGRVLAVPLLIICLYAGGDTARWLAFGIFVSASVTDWLDGYLARRWSQESALGTMLDPIADKLLVAAALFMLVADGTIAGLHTLAAILILAREVLVSGLREFLAGHGVKVPVTQLAKVKTLLQMCALALLLAAPVGAEQAAMPAGLAALWLAALLTIWTGAGYLRVALAHAIESDTATNRARDVKPGDNTTSDNTTTSGEARPRAAQRG